MKLIAIFLFFAVPSFGATTSPTTKTTNSSIKCEAKGSGITLEFPVTPSEGQTLTGDVSVIGAARDSATEVISVPSKQVVGYWADDSQFSVKALDETMKDRVLELHTKKGKGTLFLRLGKVFLENVKLTCQ